MLKKNITSVVISVAVACLFSFVCRFAETFSTVLPIVLMVTFSVCSAVAEKEYVAVSGVISVFASYFICGDVIVIYTAIVSVAAGIIVGEMVKREMSVMSLTVASATGFVVLYAVYIFVFAKMNGYGSLNEIFDVLTQTMVQTMSAVDESGVEMAQLIARTFRDLFPSIVIISSVSVGYIIVFLTGAVLSLKKDAQTRDMGFSKFKADRLTTFIFLVSMAVTLFAGYGKVGIIAENIYTILMFVLQICGLSLLDWILKYVKKMKLIFRILIIFAVNIIPIASLLLVMAAILDARRNFRRLS